MPAKGIFSLFIPIKGIHKLNGREYVGLRGSYGRGYR